jgi:glycosyltransferase involved in cell wall biosynthesis
MMELADTLVPQGISFPGFRRDIPDWLRASDCAIVPSHVEPLGLAVMEALAAGLPVVATGVGGIPEMIQDGVTGILVAPEAPAELAAAMTYVVSNQEKVREVGLRAHAYARAHFTIERHVREIVSIYEELLTMWPKRTGEAR